MSIHIDWTSSIEYNSQLTADFGLEASCQLWSHFLHKDRKKALRMHLQ